MPSTLLMPVPAFLLLSSLILPQPHGARTTCCPYRVVLVLLVCFCPVVLAKLVAHTLRRLHTRRQCRVGLVPHFDLRVTCTATRCDVVRSAWVPGDR